MKAAELVSGRYWWSRLAFRVRMVGSSRTVPPQHHGHAGPAGRCLTVGICAGVTSTGGGAGVLWQVAAAVCCGSLLVVGWLVGGLSRQVESTFQSRVLMSSKLVCCLLFSLSCKTHQNWCVWQCAACMVATLVQWLACNSHGGFISGCRSILVSYVVFPFSVPS